MCHLSHDCFALWHDHGSLLMELTKLNSLTTAFLVLRLYSCRYKENLFKEGEIGGHCELNKDLLSQQGAHKSPLQSWYVSGFAVCVLLLLHLELTV